MAEKPEIIIFQIYENQIFRYLENPSESLASIKEDEHIVAYRLPKKAPGTRVEIIHRPHERLACFRIFSNHCEFAIFSHLAKHELPLCGF